MNLLDLTDKAYQNALILAYRDRKVNPSRYAEFSQDREHAARTMEAFKSAIDEITRQMEIARSSEKPINEKWYNSAGVARKYMRFERRRVEEMLQSENRAKYLDLIEELAIRLENAGHDISDLMYPGGDTPLDRWLDLREQAREEGSLAA